MFFKDIREWAIALVQRMLGIDARHVAVKDLISVVESAAELRDAARRLQDAHPASASILLDAASQLEAQQVGLAAPLLNAKQQPTSEPAPALPGPKPVPQLPAKRGPGRPRKIDLPPTSCHDSSSNGQA